jgi:hypothetical protein
MFYRKFILPLSAILLSTQVMAISPEELMSQALLSGQASGVLTGAIAENIKKQTHSLDDTLASISRKSIDSEKCHIYHFKITQPNIPSTDGAIVGDYVTVAQSRVCPDNREQAPAMVIECRVGKVSCMPGKPSVSPAANKPQKQ